VREHVELYGNVCFGYNRVAHHAMDLTADHVEPIARGGRGDVIEILCRSCNSAKGASTRQGRGDGTSREIVPGT
jgi:5-methylcytosine-specific restriction endonuclease McrA